MEHTTIPATCTQHGSAHYCNLRLVKAAGTIALDPHVDGGCVLTLDEAEAAKLTTILASWLGLKVIEDEPAPVRPIRKRPRGLAAATG